MSSNKSDSASSAPLGGAVASGSDEAEGPICQLVVNGKFLAELTQ